MSAVKPQPLLIKRKIVSDDGFVGVVMECGHEVSKLAIVCARGALALVRGPTFRLVNQEFTCLDCTHKPDERAAADARIAEKAAKTPPAKTHDYTKQTWGHDCTFTPLDSGTRGFAVGWGLGLSAGDFILLPNRGETTRYKIETIAYHRDPPDMWRAELSFAPRPPAREGMS
ncbi:MAG: hypothetical protein ACHREM_04640 [Polyangiales bacterium]